MDLNEMKACLKEIVDRTNRVYARERHWGVERVVLMDPAEDAEIRTLSASLPFPLPASYGQFLSLHNGALGFWLRMALLGTRGECRDIVAAEVEDARDHQRQFVVDEKGQVTEAGIARLETPTEARKCLYLPKHTVFGTNERGGFLLFNERVLSLEGEYQVVHYSYSGDTGEIYADFGVYLRGVLEILENRIKEKGY